MDDDKELEILKYRADNGVVEAQKSLAMYYELGLETKVDRKSALKYWKMAAEAGDAFAHLQVAKILATSSDAGIKAKGVEYARAAHKKGYADPKAKMNQLVVESRFDGKALIVDDSGVDRVAIKHQLQKKGITADIAEDGLVAEQMLVLNPKDYVVVFIDIHMPQIGGIDLIKKIRSHSYFKSLPIVVVSAGTSSKAIKDARSLGVIGWLVKPIVPERLQDMLLAASKAVA